MNPRPLVCACCASMLTPAQVAQIEADLLVLAAAAATPFPSQEDPDA